MQQPNAQQRIAFAFGNNAIQCELLTDQVAALTAEIDSLKSQLDTVSKERDALKGEAAKSDPPLPSAQS